MPALTALNAPSTLPAGTDKVTENVAHHVRFGSFALQRVSALVRSSALLPIAAPPACVTNRRDGPTAEVSLTQGQWTGPMRENSFDSKRRNRDDTALSLA
jgi:hypothetical protein